MGTEDSKQYPDAYKAINNSTFWNGWEPIDAAGVTMHPVDVTAGATHYVFRISDSTTYNPPLAEGVVRNDFESYNERKLTREIERLRTIETNLTDVLEDVVHEIMEKMTEENADVLGEILSYLEDRIGVVSDVLRYAITVS